MFRPPKLAREVAASIALVVITGLVLLIVLPVMAVLVALIVLLVIPFSAAAGYLAIRYHRLVNAEKSATVPELPNATWPSLDSMIADGTLGQHDRTNFESLASTHEITPDQVMANTFDSIANGTVSMWVVPLADFSRIIGSRPDTGFLGRFVIMFPVGYDSRLTDPVRDGTSNPNFFLSRVNPPFVTDFASIPGPLQAIAGPPVGSYSRAAVVHDWAYSHYRVQDRRVSKRLAKSIRAECDNAMLALMRQDLTPAKTRARIYLGLQLGGKRAFREAPERRRVLEEQTDSLLTDLLPSVRSAMYRHLQDYLEIQALDHAALRPVAEALEAGDLGRAREQLVRLVQTPETPDEVRRIATSWLTELMKAMKSSAMTQGEPSETN